MINVKIKVLVIKKHSSNWLETAISEYVKRMPSIKIEWHFLKDDKQLEKYILNNKKENYYLFLDEHSKQFTSIDFATKLQCLIESSNKTISFVIGGAGGFNENILDKADLKISFSKLTFPNQFCRLLLVEQIYRAFEILKGSKYHK